MTLGNFIQNYSKPIKIKCVEDNMTVILAKHLVLRNVKFLLKHNSYLNHLCFFLSLLFKKQIKGTWTFITQKETRFLIFHTQNEKFLFCFWPEIHLSTRALDKEIGLWHK
jgi:hypothetical protein